ncbi:hypothetical protein T265_07565 [Opisthorchis viverrini]|uniref:Uncharacterized protein n=1 Tax=Opisthorchis viverrini TaxID=6198 RepID=A0A074ZCE4_OPIVI|nr:hypothetical protein T265_07565 [Opisthorchis viverrini]KER24833.1 hypothetical protein T265_07565 [Opisthorchis viverrini]
MAMAYIGQHSCINLSRTEATPHQCPAGHPNGEYIYLPLPVVDTKVFIAMHHLQIRTASGASGTAELKTMQASTVVKMNCSDFIA